jgi:transposase-like protein
MATSVEATALAHYPGYTHTQQPYGLRRSVNLDKLVAEMYVRGLSTRDIEDPLKEISDDGKTLLLSKSSVSQVGKKVRDLSIAA